MTTAAYLDNPLVFEATSDAVGIHLAEIDAEPLSGILPEVVAAWLARVRLLEGVPFAHLVPDSALLPLESIRFFYLDRDWTDTLVQGVLSVGTITTLDRVHLQALHARIRDELDGYERTVRLVGSDAPGAAAAETVTGFLLRSRAVSGWPALHVRGFREEVGLDTDPVAADDPRRLRLLRLERLAPAVLLCLFDGIPKVVHIEEPRQGIQFGVDLVPNATGTRGATIPLRDVSTAERLDQTTPAPPLPHTADVPFRRGAPGVVHVTELARRIAAVPATNTSAFEGPGLASAEFALEMLQFPFRQVFGDPALGGSTGGQTLAFADLFRPVVEIEQIREWMVAP